MKDTTCELITDIPVTRRSGTECIKTVLTWIEKGERCHYFVCTDAFSFGIMRRDQEYKESILNADLSIPGSQGIVLGSRILGGGIHERVAGRDMFLGLSRILNERGGYSYFFLGSSAVTLSSIRKRMGRQFPNITISGTYSPPYRQQFSDAENAAMVDLINRANPDVLWVGMSAPKQEKWIYGHSKSLNAKMAGPIGAVFDYYAGTTVEVPHWMQRAGLEWLHRFSKEPLKIWRRIFIYVPWFFYRVLSVKVKSLFGLRKCEVR